MTCAATGLVVKIAAEGGVCPRCNGSGKSGTSNADGTDMACTACHGSGVRSVPTGESCPVCEGAGRIAC